MSGRALGGPNQRQVSSQTNTYEQTNEAKEKAKFSDWFGLFVRQELPSWWDPRPSLLGSFTAFFILCLITIPMGGILLWQSLENTEVIIRYDDFSVRESNNNDNQQRRQTITNYSTPEFTRNHVMSIPEKLESPVYVYYELRDFFQNHKRYVQSVADNQIGGDSVRIKDLDVCDPYKAIPKTSTNPPPDAERIINPCGLIAHSFFNDTFTLESSIDVVNNRTLGLEMKETGIAPKGDRDHLYGDTEPQNFNNDTATRGGGTINNTLNEAEHLMVWMRAGARPTIRKLYGIIEEDIPKGANLTFKIVNRYNTYDFDGQKRLILTTTNWTGGRSIFLGVLYFVIGGLSALACLAIIAYDYSKKRATGDLSALSWRKKDS